MIFIYIVLAIGGLIAFLLLTPLVVEVDSARSIVGIYLRGILAGELTLAENRLLIRLWILGWRKTIDPFERSKKEKAIKKHATKRKRKRRWVSKFVRKARAVLASFHVQYFYMNIDTEDYLMNAWLYPIAVLSSRPGRTFHINFNGDIVIRLRIQNRLGRMLLAFIR